MKRYFLFGNWNFYPSGGWRDFQGCFETEQQAIEKGKTLNPDAPGGAWFHVDSTTMLICHEENT